MFKQFLENSWNALINYKVNLILIWPSNCVIVSTNIANQNATFTITETKLYLPIVTLSIHGNGKLLTQLKSGFKIIISWNKYLSKPELLAPNQISRNSIPSVFLNIFIKKERIEL